MKRTLLIVLNLAAEIAFWTVLLTTVFGENNASWQLIAALYAVRILTGVLLWRFAMLTNYDWKTLLMVTLFTMFFPLSLFVVIYLLGLEASEKTVERWDVG